MSTTDDHLDEDAKRLQELGYTQELRRGMSGFSNFAVSFSIISILAGCITSYYLAMDAGGPIVITIGWPIVGLLVSVVALAMAEVCSTYPTAGGLYCWAGRLAGRTRRWAWFVGWFNFLGEVAVTAAIDFGAAVTSMALLNLTFDFDVTLATTFIAFLVIIGLHGLLNTFGVNLVKLLSDVWRGGTWSVSPSSSPSCGIVPDQHQRPRVDVHRVPERDRLGRAAVYVVPARSADGPVHLHRVRRARPRRGGDQGRASTAAPRASCAASGSR